MAIILADSAPSEMASLVVDAILIVTSVATILSFVLSVPNALHMPGFIRTSEGGTGGAQLLSRLVRLRS